MKTLLRLTISIFLLVVTPYVIAANNNQVTITENVCPDDEGLNCFRVQGWSKGNHAVDCTVIVPDGRPNRNPPYPLIAWANGWDQGNVLGQCTINGYLPGLKQWAHDGPYIIAAANQWSVQESDVLACVDWVVGNKSDDLPADETSIGLVGHSQGGGAVIKAGNGTKKGPEITTVIAMNPYGPSWVNPEDQDGPVLLLGGTADLNTPPASYQAVWDAIKTQGDPGGVITELAGGTHNSEAWGTDDVTGETLSCEEAATKDFGEYQGVGLLWWQIHLEGINGHRATLERILNSAPWVNTEYSNF